MKIKLEAITVADLVAEYYDKGEAGVTGFGGKLDIRSAYQREFVYKDKQRNAVIDTVRKGGRLDGALGVVGGIVALAYLH